MEELYYSGHWEAEERRRAAAAAAALASYDAALGRLSRAPEEVPLTRATIGTPKTDPSWHEFVVTILVCLPVLGGLLAAFGVGRAFPDGPRTAVTVGALGTAAVVVLLLMVAALWLADRLDRAGRRDALLHTGTAMTAACVRALDASDAERAEHLRELDDLYRRTERLLLRAHRVRGTIGGSSPRRAAARRHAELVAGALRRELCRVDAEPQGALPDLAGKLVTVCERYAEGRIGRLLPEEDLADVEPVTVARQALRESALMVVVILVAFCGALGAWLGCRAAGVPDDLLPLAAAAGLLLGGTLAGGWRRAVRLVELLPGL
ncbi:hypothetical protein ACF09K_25590 [Streptomyces sp. NPDC014882]|uniref:hypothetical protein n=1 Tax=Streptomyces sp. NPDC014882 TaxID=3364927 RepID=UPI0036F76B02